MTKSVRTQEARRFPVGDWFEGIDRTNSKVCSPIKHLGLPAQSPPELSREEFSMYGRCPEHCCKFREHLDDFVEPEAVNPGQRLLYLERYCRGQTRVSIDECSVSEAAQENAWGKKIF